MHIVKLDGLIIHLYFSSPKNEVAHLRTYVLCMVTAFIDPGITFMTHNFEFTLKCDL